MNKNKINILFKGRFEKIKGCYQFINSIDFLDQNCKGRLIIMIGKGAEKYPKIG